MDKIMDSVIQIDNSDYILIRPFDIKITANGLKFYLSIQKQNLVKEGDISMISYLNYYILPRLPRYNEIKLDCKFNNRMYKDCKIPDKDFIIRLKKDNKYNQTYKSRRKIDLFNMIQKEYLDENINFFDNGMSFCISFFSDFLPLNEESKNKLSIYWDLYNSEDDTEKIVLQRRKIGQSIIDDIILSVRKLSKKGSKLIHKLIHTQKQNDLGKLLIKAYSEQAPLKELEDMWHDKFYGPIVASLIYIANILENIPIRALQNTWSKLRNEIIELGKKLENSNNNQPLFIKIYSELQKSGKNLCYYSEERYNFISDFYMFGSCNCACGVFLAYVIYEMFPDENYKISALLIPDHILIILRDKKGNIYELETTNPDNYFSEIDKEKYKMKGFGMIHSAQSLAIFNLISNSTGYFISDNKIVDTKKLIKTIIILSYLFGIKLRDSVCERKDCENNINSLSNLKDREIFNTSGDIRFFFYYLFDFLFQIQKYYKYCKYSVNMTYGVYKRSRVNFRSDYENFVKNIENDPKKVLESEIEFYIQAICKNNDDIVEKYKDEKFEK
jgi:hypothetical protein